MITLNNEDIEFQIDTGADVTVTTERDYNAIRDGPLAPPKRSLSGPSRQTLDVLGKFCFPNLWGKARNICGTRA